MIIKRGKLARLVAPALITRRQGRGSTALRLLQPAASSRFEWTTSPPSPTDSPLSLMAHYGAHPTGPDLGGLFAAVDRDRSGQITVDELQMALSNGGWKPFQRHTASMMVNMFDADRSGSIGFAEFQNLWGYLSQWRQIFDSFDGDRSGSISFPEFEKAVAALGYRLPQPLTVQLMQAYDKDRSGSIGFDEFIRLFCELQTITSHFQRLDTDRDGVISLSYDNFLQIIFSARG